MKTYTIRLRHKDKSGAFVHLRLEECRSPGDAVTRAVKVLGELGLSYEEWIPEYPEEVSDS